MRLCADENMPCDGVAALRSRGHDVVWKGLVMSGAADERVIPYAITEQRILITFDKDFGELGFRQKKSGTAGIILFQISQPSAAAVAQRIVRVLKSRNDWNRHFSVVDDGTLRMRVL